MNTCKVSFYFLLFCVFLQSFFSISMAYKIDSTLFLINEEWISNFISEKSLLEAHEYGIEMLELDTLKLKKATKEIFVSNIPFADTKVGFYFYDCFTMESCTIDGNRCNSVQMKIEISFMKEEIERIVCYELSKKN